MIKFSKANGKLQKLAKALNIPNSNVVSIGLPSGFTCPKADQCLSKADRKTGKITDGKDMTFRCFATSLESIYPSLRNRVWDNFETIKQAIKEGTLVDQLQEALNQHKKAKVVRIHTSGDFFNKAYYEGFKELAKQNQDVVFYAYSKILEYVGDKERPDNFRMVYSIGGKDDKKFLELDNVPYSKVIYNASQADADIDIDDNDIHAYKGISSNLIIHGSQPKHINTLVKSLKS
jgi:hypothetical protein